MNTNQTIKFLHWDSHFFGVNIGLVKSIDLEVGHWPAMLEECRGKNLACLYLLAEPYNTAIIRIAESSGFRYMDVRLTLRYQRSSPQNEISPHILSGHILRNATSQDLSALKTIARISHQNTRFYVDPNFSRIDCDRLYETWIENSLNGYAQQVFVAENRTSSEAEAYITCHLNNNQGEIGLIAVHPSARGNRIGTNLIQKALDWFFENGASEIEVVTQGGSRPALNLYQKAGFQVSNLQLWFHKWFELPKGEYNSPS